MNVLVFYPYIPYPLDRGTFQRTFHLLRELARVHTVDFLVLAEKGTGREHLDVFRAFCRKVECVDFEHPHWPRLWPDRLLNPLPTTIAHWSFPQLPPVLDRMLSEESYDFVHACDIVLCQYFLKKHKEIPLVVDRSRVDLQFQWMEHQQMNFPLRTRLLRYEGYAKLWKYERLVGRRVRLEVVCGPDDKVFIHKRIASSIPVQVINNGVDETFFRPDAVPDQRSPVPTIMFCGAMDYNPNIDALRWYFSTIHEALVRRVPRLQVWIVGKNPVEEVRQYDVQHVEVTVTGGVPDVRPYYRRAWIQIVPLRIGGGTRLKIVESMCIGTPVVSTSIGAQGLPVKHDHDILLADSPSQFVDQTVRVLEKPELRSQLEHEGRKNALSSMTWSRLGQQLAEVYAGLFPPKSKP